MELVSHLYRFLVDGVVVVKEQVTLVNRLLKVLASTLKISQKRKIYQPHFNLSVDGLCQICELLSTNDDAITCANAKIGLKAILMSTPPAAIFCMVLLSLSLSRLSAEGIILLVYGINDLLSPCLVVHVN